MDWLQLMYQAQTSLRGLPSENLTAKKGRMLKTGLFLLPVRCDSLQWEELVQEMAENSCTMLLACFLLE